MIFELASAVAAYAAAAQPAAPSGELENLFISACFNGSVRVGEGQAETVGFDALPSPIRNQLKTPSKAQVWKLRSAGDTYLYMLEYSDPKRSPQVCGLTSDQLPMSHGVDAVAYYLRSSNDVDPRSFGREWWMPEEGYMALATRIRGYTTLQVNRLSEWQRSEALENR